MTTSKKASILLGILMCTVSVLAYTAKPTKLLANFAEREPLVKEMSVQIHGWREQLADTAFVVDPTQLEVLNYLYSETFSANYSDSANSSIMLSIAYGKDQSDGRDVHKPDLCYPAQGFAVIEARDVQVALDDRRSIVVRYMKTQKGQRIEPLIYWTTAGNYLYQNKLEKKLVAFKYSTHNLIPDGMVVRVSMLQKAPEADLNTLVAFVKDWYTSLPEAQRGRFFGDGNR